MALKRVCDVCDKDVDDAENYRLQIELEKRLDSLSLVANIPRQEMDLCGTCARHLRQAIQPQPRCA